ncbi:hypothetical protein MVEN_01848500 [Mycena venus]|uniref:G-protein coupled receptors family 2 profile 2 domain-containing protein n=1 Tax=Mycena venus TaxID=2733690 RepID=A0A8H7CKK0_9AGAR|nr:hypothetical protein MVEN_01848500 [Mycena venus]
MSSMSTEHEAKLLAFINTDLPFLLSDVTLGVAIPGVALTVILLAAIAYLQWNPVSRPHLDRVSFRLIIYTLIANLIFGSMMFANMKETTPGCSLVAFLGVTSPLFSACMSCCVALNLQLVLVYSVNGNMMEKFYILGTVFVCLACSIPTLAAGEFGWYATNGACWLRAPTPTVQLDWLLATYSVPTLLMSTVEVFSFVNILIFMLRHEIRSRSLRADTSTMSTSASESGIVTLASGLPKHPVVKFRSMIIRIALYPLLSCFLSSTACVLDVYSVLHPDLTDFNINLRTTNLCIYSFRPLLYTLLAATDPSFIRAVRSLSLKTCSSQCPHHDQTWSPCGTAKTHSFELPLAELALAQQRSRNDREGEDATKKTAASYADAGAEDNAQDRRPSAAPAEQAPLVKDDFQSEGFAHQI